MRSGKPEKARRLAAGGLYVVCHPEPCQMCAGAIVQARVSEVVIGSMNPKAGCAGSILNMLEMHEFNHQGEGRARRAERRVLGDAGVRFSGDCGVVKKKKRREEEGGRRERIKEEASGWDAA